MFNFGTVTFFHDSVQYLAKSGYPFTGANIHELSIPGYVLSPLLSPGPIPHLDTPHVLTESVKQMLPQGQGILL